MGEIELQLIWAGFVYPLYLKSKPVILLVLNSFKLWYVYLQITSTHIWVAAHTSVGPRHVLKNSLLYNSICIFTSGPMGCPSSLRVQGKCIHWQMWLCNSGSINQEINEGADEQQIKSKLYWCVLLGKDASGHSEDTQVPDCVQREEWDNGPGWDTLHILVCVFILPYLLSIIFQALH